MALSLFGPVQPRAQRADITFSFDGKTCRGKAGDTLAAALLANGISVVGRSFKYHRPRGVIGAWVEDPNALVQIGRGAAGEPNVRATCIEIYQGMQACSQNAWPNVRFDLLSVLDRLRAFLPASFYYKTMIWPHWSFYEHIIRRIAGLGRAPDGPDPSRYASSTLHCDVLVCGGGPAGLAASLTAAQSGVRVVLAEDHPEPGGALRYEQFALGGNPALAWVGGMVSALEALPNMRILRRTCAFGAYENNVVAALETPLAGSGTNAPRCRLHRIHARQIILATGAIERPLVFPDNDRPGVMLASAVREYADFHQVAPWRRAVLVTNNDDAYRTAFRLHDLGSTHVTVADMRHEIPPHISDAASQRGIRILAGYHVAGVLGGARLRGLRLRPQHASDGAMVSLPCDLVAMSGGWNPTVHLYSQAGGQLGYDEHHACLRPRGGLADCRIVGAADGVFTLAGCIDAGSKAGALAACAVSGQTVVQTPSPPVDHDPNLGIEAFWFTPGAPLGRQWIDFQYDVRVRDLQIAEQENFISIEHVKRYTTGGMSIDQGKLANVNIIGAMATLTGQPIESIGTTRYRPPFQPVTIGAMAAGTTGDYYAPWQILPAHDWHERRNARFGDYRWRRPDCYPRNGETPEQAALREVRAVRGGVGIFDASPLGKIEIFGPDAAIFLDRVFVNTLSTLKPGHARYAVMANEQGIIVDDGVVVRLAPGRFLVHATSGSVARTAASMQKLPQCDWPDLAVGIEDVTTAWATLTLSGLGARALLADIGTDIPLSPDEFPHMRFRQGHVWGIAARVLRASFTGEATYEISIPARFAIPLLEHIELVGKEHNLVPYGIDALEIMRLEKGYLHVGADTDQTTTPLDIGFRQTVARKTIDFVGRRSLMREAEQGKSRLQLVGIVATGDQTRALPKGGHIVSGSSSAERRSQGYVTSSCVSPTLNASIGLALLERGQERLGDEVCVFHQGRRTGAKIVPATHYDPGGGLLDGRV